MPKSVNIYQVNIYTKERKLWDTVDQAWIDARNVEGSDLYLEGHGHKSCLGGTYHSWVYERDGTDHLQETWPDADRGLGYFEEGRASHNLKDI